MTAPKIEPALTETEWAASRQYRNDPRRFPPLEGGIPLTLQRIGATDPISGEIVPAKAVAIFNDLLHDSDPRKITWEDVAVLIDVLAFIRGMDSACDATISRLADALGSYLPPEKLPT